VVRGTFNRFKTTVHGLLIVLVVGFVSTTTYGQIPRCAMGWNIGLPLLSDASRNICRDLETDRRPNQFAPEPSPEVRYRIRVNAFLKDLERFCRLGIEVASYRYAPIDQAWAVQGLGESSTNLRRTTNGIIEFVDIGFDYPPATVVRTARGNPHDQLIEVGSMVEQVLPRVFRLTTGHVLDIDHHREIHQVLFEIKAFSHFKINE